MMHKAWSSIEEVPYCIARSSVKFHGHTGGKNWRFESNLRLLGRSQLSNPSDLPCSRSSVKFQVHTEQKIANFDLNWAFPDCNSSLNSPMALEWCTKLDIVWKRCPIVFQGHTGQKIANFEPNWAFPDCNPSANSLMALKWWTKINTV